MTPGRRTNRKNSVTVKEQLCCTPCIFWVNKKNRFLCALKSIKCSSFTGACSGDGAVAIRQFARNPRRMRNSGSSCGFHASFAAAISSFHCENPERIRSGQGKSMERKRSRGAGKGFDLDRITSTVGAPSFAHFAKGGAPRRFAQVRSSRRHSKRCNRLAGQTK